MGVGTVGRSDSPPPHAWRRQHNATMATIFTIAVAASPKFAAEYKDDARRWKSKRHEKSRKVKKFAKVYRRQLVMSGDVGRDSERRLMKKLEKYEEDSGRQQKADGKRRPTLGGTMRLHGKGESLPRRDAASSTTGGFNLHLDDRCRRRRRLFPVA